MKENEVISRVIDALAKEFNVQITYSISGKTEDKSNPHQEIIEYLNELTGSKYKSNSKATQKLINGRLSEGYSIADFKAVIGIKVKDWQGGKFEQYLRPSTLFAPSKFEEYLNQKEEIKQQTFPEFLHEMFEED